MWLAAATASADVDATGQLTPSASSLRSSSVHGVQPLVNSEHDGIYECSSAHEYSPLHAEAFGLVIGNCKAGWKFEVVDYGGPSKGNYSYGGHSSNLESCGWIESTYAPEHPTKATGGACNQGQDVSTTPASAYLERKNSGTEDGYYVVNPEPCKEYANFQPWSTSNVEKNYVGTVAAYEESSAGKRLPAIKWRYITKNASTDGTGKYVMVRVENSRVSEGQINWVFVPRSCLPTSLPESEGTLLPNPPSVTTGGYSNVTETSAVLSGSVNPDGLETHYYIEWGREASKPYEAFAPTPYPGEDIGSGTKEVAKSVTATSLMPNTVYYYRVVAKSPTGTSEGALGSFTTLPEPPEVSTSAASSVTEEQATLNGTVNPKGTATGYHFQYGETSAYGFITPEGNAGSGLSNVPESAILTGLEGGTTYYYRLVASNGGGTREGSDQTFATVSKPAVYVNGTTTQDAYFRGTNGAIWQWQWEATNAKWYLTELGGQTGGEPWRQAAGSPTAYLDGGNQMVYFSGTNGAIWQWQNEASNHKWSLTEL
jgi:hypothetical protein